MIDRELAYLAAAFAFVGGLAWGYRWGWGARARQYRALVTHIHSGDVLAAVRRSRRLRERQRKIRVGGRESDGGEGPHPEDAA